MPQKPDNPKEHRIGINDVPEIAVISREIERFKKMMLRNPSQEEEDSYKAVAERHFLNGLERARDLLIQQYLESRPASNE